MQSGFARETPIISTRKTDPRLEIQDLGLIKENNSGF